jgi:2-iminobutanoate/2-iminopropanoate deaminase
MRLIAIATGALMMTSTAMAGPPEYRSRPSVDSNPLPFSEAVFVGDLLILSGQIGIAPDGKLPQGIGPQTKQAMDNVGAVLKRSGLTYDDVVKCTVMLDDMADWSAFNKAYVPYFKPDRMPARSAFGAKGLALGAKVEIECWAYAGNK